MESGHRQKPYGAAGAAAAAFAAPQLLLPPLLSLQLLLPALLFLLGGGCCSAQGLGCGLAKERRVGGLDLLVREALVHGPVSEGVVAGGRKKYPRTQGHTSRAERRTEAFREDYYQL